jgi:pimeloyl-ACP methyl ester carboxylesterase
MLCNNVFCDVQSQWSWHFSQLFCPRRRRKLLPQGAGDAHRSNRGLRQRSEFPTNGIARSSLAATPHHLRSIRHVGTIRQGGHWRTEQSGPVCGHGTNDGHGVPVLISNGLGTPHHAWPDINRRTDTYRVMTWDHRGLGGSERPSDESRINISDHTDDLFAVMDSYGIDRAVSPGPAPCRATRTRTPSRWAATRPHPAARPEVSRPHAPAHQPAQ